LKKNIIIFGASRAGKTTLAKKLNEKLNFSVIGTDDITDILRKSFPELMLNDSNDWEKTMANFAPFIAHFIGTLDYRSKCFNGTNFIIEGWHYDFEKMLPILKMYEIEELSDYFLLIGLVYPNKTPKEYFNDRKKYDSTDDWTYNLCDEELKGLSIDAVEYNRKILDKYSIYNPRIYDVSQEREQVLDKIVSDIASL